MWNTLTEILILISIFSVVRNASLLKNKDQKELEPENDGINLQDVWLPNLRGIPIGRPGSIVAEFSVSSSSTDKDDKKKKEEKKRFPNFSSSQSKNHIRASIPCADPSSVLDLKLKASNSVIRSDKNLAFTEEAPRILFFGVSEVERAEVKGSCCWELFDRVGYTGRMLRLCPGNYGHFVLEDFAKNVRSVRPIEYFAKQ